MIRPPEPDRAHNLSRKHRDQAERAMTLNNKNPDHTVNIIRMIGGIIRPDRIN
ncbi:hypothetical protein [Acetobacter syzygii]|uniref:hypothetical protein n=1 Tax=Acetobacter syzygii TaxID=146476 RepID=UPI0039ECBA15